MSYVKSLTTAIILGDKCAHQTTLFVSIIIHISGSYRHRCTGGANSQRRALITSTDSDIVWWYLAYLCTETTEPVVYEPLGYTLLPTQDETEGLLMFAFTQRKVTDHVLYCSIQTQRVLVYVYLVCICSYIWTYAWIYMHQRICKHI